MEKSSIVKEMEYRSEKLDGFESVIGLPPNCPPGSEEELNEYLSMNKEILEKMSSRRAVSISIRLSQYAVYMQRCINREKSVRTWANQKLTDIVAKHFNDYDKFLKADIRESMVCMENKVAKEYRDIKLYCDQRINRIEELSAGIKNLSYVVSLIQKEDR